MQGATTSLMRALLRLWVGHGSSRVGNRSLSRNLLYVFYANRNAIGLDSPAAL